MNHLKVQIKNAVSRITYIFNDIKNPFRKIYISMLNRMSIQGGYKSRWLNLVVADFKICHRIPQTTMKLVPVA